jgi:hypothetical protein
MILNAVGVLREVFRQNFQRNLAAELRVCGAVHFAHAALAELGGELDLINVRLAAALAQAVTWPYSCFDLA